MLSFVDPLLLYWHTRSVDMHASACFLVPSIFQAPRPLTDNSQKTSLLDLLWLKFRPYLQHDWFFILMVFSC